MNGPNTTDFASWIDAARAGDQSALAELIQHVRDYLLLVANQELSPALRRKVAPSDLVQETFVQLQRNLDQFRGSSEKELLSWVRRILLNGICDTHRRYRADIRDAAREQPLAGDSVFGVPLADLPGDSPHPSAVAVERETSEALHRAIQELSDEYREVLRLRTWEGLSFAEIGNLLNRSPDAARMLWNRAVQRLQDQLEFEDDRG